MNFNTITHVLLILFVLVSLTTCRSRNSIDSIADKPIREVGFDLDDTLVFSTPTFERAYKMAKSRNFEPFSKQFWSVVNALDASRSCIKTSVVDILEKHQRRKREIFVITAREPYNTEPARKFVNETFGIPEDHLYFEPNGKTKRLKELGIDIFYGDSDSDVTDAQKAGIKAVRVQRNPKSAYEIKYHPGKFGETILSSSASHICR